jgi:hypothetical protein
MRTDHVLIKADNFTCYGQNKARRIRPGESNAVFFKCVGRDAATKPHKTGFSRYAKLD